MFKFILNSCVCISPISYLSYQHSGCKHHDLFLNKLKMAMHKDKKHGSFFLSFAINGQFPVRSQCKKKLCSPGKSHLFHRRYTQRGGCTSHWEICSSTQMLLVFGSVVITILVAKKRLSSTSTHMFKGTHAVL